MDDFIEEYKTYILDRIPTQPEWAEAIAITVLSTAVGPDRKLPDRIGKLELNTWFLMIGPSGIAYKSAPLKYIVTPTLIKMTEFIDYPIILPHRWSIEGLIEYMAKGFNVGIIVRDEFTGLFKETHKQYLLDAMEFMSELYDGTLKKRYTRKAKLEEVMNVYVSICYILKCYHTIFI